MNDKKRFFYVVCISANGTHTATTETDGGMFSGKDLICRVAQRESKEMHQVAISHWHEFDNEQDYKEFFR